MRFLCVSNILCALLYTYSFIKYCIIQDTGYSVRIARDVFSTRASRSMSLKVLLVLLLVVAVVVTH